MPDQVKGGPHELTEAQKKLVAEDPAQTLDQQENMKISGSNARHMVMQKLMRKSEVRGTGGRGQIFGLLRFKAVFRTLLGPYAVIWSFISFGRGCPGGQLSADACRQTNCSARSSSACR